jgi:hypothetical protein
MAWFRNFYQCYRCDAEWDGNWSCMVDEECPNCEAKDIAPSDADDLTFLVIKRTRSYVVLWSPDTAERAPDYREIAEYRTLDLAETYMMEAEDNAS